MLAPDMFPFPLSEGDDLAASFTRAEPAGGQTGFQGAMANLTLADVVQLEGQNQFSGSILVSYQEQEGQIFFQKGDVVHSEVGSFSGEEAFRRILAWPGGHFRMQANVTSLHRSIEKRLDHLILSAHQWLDEKRHSGELDQELDRRATPRGQTDAGVVQDFIHAVRNVPGVACVALVDRNGTPRSALSPQGEGLAARGLYLASQVGDVLGGLLGLGDLRVAALLGGEDRILLFRSRETYLAVALTQDAAPEDTESRIRQTIAARKARR